MRADIGDVRNPVGIGRLNIELPVQPVGRYNRRLADAGSRTASVANLRSQTFTVHQPGNPVLAASLTQVTQVLRHLAVAINRAAFQPGLLDQTQKALIFRMPSAVGLALPGVKAAALDA
jgi:hypothetical protein